MLALTETEVEQFNAYHRYLTTSDKFGNGYIDCRNGDKEWDFIVRLVKAEHDRRQEDGTR